MTQHGLLIQVTFSKASKAYDEFSLLQRQIADELLKKIESVPAGSTVLDIGMGTGYLLEKLRRSFAAPALYGCDFAFGMLQQAHENHVPARLVQADAGALPFGDNTFALVVSNVSYQWVGDLVAAFREVKRVLRENGKFYFTVFAGQTLGELREIILDTRRQGAGSINGTLPTRASVQAALKELSFCDIKIEEKRSRSYYRNLGELLSWLKQIGANRYLPQQLHRGLSARTLLNTLSKEYEHRFKEDGKIFATFEVLYVQARKV